MNDRMPVLPHGSVPGLASLPRPAKALITTVIFTMGIGMLGALGQIMVHEIGRGVYAVHILKQRSAGEAERSNQAAIERGDLLKEERKKEREDEPFYKTEQFVWTLKWTHIHLFGMNMIFIFLGTITFFLRRSARTRAWLIVLPFIGVIIDIACMWRRGSVSPGFFWMHLPGGGLFVTMFLITSVLALWQMCSPAAT